MLSKLSLSEEQWHLRPYACDLFAQAAHQGGFAHPGPFRDKDARGGLRTMTWS